MRFTKQLLASLLASAMLLAAVPAFAAEGRTNIALGKSYTVKGILKDQAGNSNYPDEEGKSLTDGKGATQVGYGDAAWVGLNLNGEGMQTTDYFKDKRKNRQENENKIPT